MSTEKNRNIREEFARFAALPDALLDPLKGALLIAAEHCTGINEETVQAKIDDLAVKLRGRSEAASSAYEQARALVTLLHKEEGFTGDEHDYYNPENSFVNLVLVRKRGIPISLALIYIAVARRANLNVDGMNTPSHFLVKLSAREEIIIDPFSGKILSEKGFRQRLQRTLQLNELPADHLIEHFRKAAGPRQMLCRMLSNLKHIFLSKHEPELALGTCERILLLTPDDPDELLQRALLYEHLNCIGAAIKDFERFLELVPAHSSSERVRHNLESLKRQQTLLH